MPSLHAADALIVGWFLVTTSRTMCAKALWAFWPVWVWFCVIATANHYVLDVLAGIGVAVAALLTTTWLPRLFGRLRDLGPVIANLL
jgi:membrane-associated phospholipid phosphatase